MRRRIKEEDLNHIVSPADIDALLDLKDEERQPCEIWTRVMGYHRPMSSFNCGKKGEFNERQYFTERQAKLG